jgi:hypothetical protein
MWYSSGRLTNPAINAVIITTGALPAKQRMFQVSVASTVAAPFEYQWLAADGTTVKNSQILACQALDSKETQPQLQEIDMLINESIRVIAVTAITGQVSASIDITL